MTSFDIGNVIRLSVAFTDSSGTPVDPGSVQLNVRAAGDAVETFTYADNQIIKDGTGLYHYDYPPATPGLYYYRFIGTDGATAAGDSQFGITASLATDSWPPINPPNC